MADLSTRSVLVLTSNYGTESAEITSPVQTLRDAGASVTVAAPESGSVVTLEGDKDPGPEVAVDALIDDVSSEGYDAVVLPGGTINADQLRTHERAHAIVKEFAAAGKPIAAICHAPWVLVDAGLVEGAHLTSVGSIRSDLVNAGASWTDEETVVDTSQGHRLITARTPDDLDPFNAAIQEALA